MLAISYPQSDALADAAERSGWKRNRFLKVGERNIKITGQFPPTPLDPYLRMVFPREIGPNDKSLVFELYLPGIGGSYAMVEFRMKELLYHGKPEM